jgi:MFS family permease
LPFLRSTWVDYRDAVRSFSHPARQFLLATFFAWMGHGISQVLFNLYLVEAGFQESFIGQAIAWNGLGLAATALPAGFLADRWGTRRCLILGALLEGVGLLLRSIVLRPDVICGASLVAGAGQSLLAIAAAPFLTEHSTARERTHLFSSFFAVELMASVAGSVIGGAIPALLARLPSNMMIDSLHAYRVTLVLGAGVAIAAALPIVALRARPEAHSAHPDDEAPFTAAGRMLWPIGLNAFLIGAGAGLVIPFMNLYFATRFQCSSAQIGVFFSLAQISTAFAAMISPVLARRFGKLRTATAFELLSLPFLITLGAERRLDIAVAAFCLRATLMQASSPLIQAFIMEALPPSLRARSTSLMNMVWNIGWAGSATVSGWIIQRFGFAMPFYITATLYGTAALFFYACFRRLSEGSDRPRMAEEAKGRRGEGPFTA